MISVITLNIKSSPENRFSEAWRSELETELAKFGSFENVGGGTWMLRDMPEEERSDNLYDFEGDLAGVTTHLQTAGYSVSEW